MSWLTPNFWLFVAVWGVTALGVFWQAPPGRWKRVVYLIGMALFFGGLLNFLMYWHVAVSLGGNAAIGKVENGKYFVGSHGKLTEVSEATWRYSLAHARSINVTHPLGAVGAVLMVLASRKKKATT